VLAYIEGDYAGAVDSDGSVTDIEEYQEQLSLVADAALLLADAGLAEGDAATRRVAELKAGLTTREPPRVVERLAREARQALVENHGLVLTPRAPPDAALGARGYTNNGCATCHGEDGAASTEAGALMEPPPANFLSGPRMRGVSPYRAFHAITHGIPGTAMSGYGSLSDAERWAMAFHVVGLRHQRGNVDHGRAVFESARLPGAWDSATLSQLTDSDLEARLTAKVAEPSDRSDVVAWLRLAPTSSADWVAETQAALAQGADAYRRGRPAEARKAFLAAYLDGIEPQEAVLSARDPKATARMEREMVALRTAVGDGRPPEEVDARVAVISALVYDLSGKSTGAWALLTAAAGLALREGLEVVLLIGALLGAVRASGRPEQARWIHAGWMAAVPIGILTWVVAGEALSGADREIAEGTIALFAAFILLLATHWTLGAALAGRWMGFLSGRLQTAMPAWMVAGLAFLAVYREALEVVLFYRALLLDAGVSGARAVASGAVLGLAVLALLAMGIRAAGRRLPLQKLMLGSAVLLATLAVMLVGKGVHSLQEAGVLGAHFVAEWGLPVVGLHPSVEGMTAQGVLALALLLSATLALREPARMNEKTGA